MGLGTDNARPDVVIDRGPEHLAKIRYWVCARGEAEAYMPARGSCLPPDTTRTGYTCDSVQVSERNPSTMWLATTYLKPKVLGTVGNLSEIARRIVRQTINGNHAVRIFEGADSTIEADLTASLPIMQIWPGSTAYNGPYINDIDIDRNSRGSIARAEVHYIPADLNQLLLIHPLTGMLEIDLGATSVYRQYDLSAKRCKGQFIDIVSGAATASRYVPISGPMLQSMPYAVLRLRTAMVNPNVLTLLGYQGKCNSNTLANLGASQYTIRMDSVRMVPVIWLGKLVQICTFIMTYRYEGWREALTVEKQRATIIEQPILASDGVTPTGAKQRIRVWEPVPGVGTETRLVADSADMAQLGVIPIGWGA